MRVSPLTVLMLPALAIALVPARPPDAVAAAETARIRTHLATVETELRRRDVSTLTPAQREARARNLAVLHQYRVHGVFPVNTDFPGQRVPYFVDRYGTRCVMAYLIEQSGHGGFVVPLRGLRPALSWRSLPGMIDTRSGAAGDQTPSTYSRRCSSVRHATGMHRRWPPWHAHVRVLSSTTISRHSAHVPPSLSAA